MISLIIGLGMGVSPAAAAVVQFSQRPDTQPFQDLKESELVQVHCWFCGIHEYFGWHCS